MLPTSGNETSTIFAGIQVSASIAHVTARDVVVPTYNNAFLHKALIFHKLAVWQKITIIFF